MLQSMARSLPGSFSLRPFLHKRRGVKMGTNVFIGDDVILDTSKPNKIKIGSNVIISLRTTLLAHFGNTGREHLDSDEPTLVIEDNVFIGPHVLIMPGVTIGEGAVVSAGSVVFRSVQPGIMVKGNPAEPVARCGIPLTNKVKTWDFYQQLRPLRKPGKQKPVN